MIDTLAPVVGTPDLTAASDTGLSQSDNETADSTPSFTGAGESGLLARLLTGATQRSSAIASGGAWSMTSSLLGLGPYPFSAAQTDLAGNPGTSGTLSVTIVEPTACHTATAVINGTNAANRITGTAGANRIFGLAGDDEISGGQGGDCIVGGDGADRINGDQGDDELRGEGGEDRVGGGAGRDVVLAGAGNDRVEVAGDGSVDRVDCGTGNGGPRRA